MTKFGQQRPPTQVGDTVFLGGAAYIVAEFSGDRMRVVNGETVDGHWISRESNAVTSIKRQHPNKSWFRVWP